MNTKTLPHPSELTAEQQLLQVDGYEMSTDSFHCVVHTAAPCEGQPCIIPACLMPKLTGEYGEPDEFIGDTFLIEM